MKLILPSNMVFSGTTKSGKTTLMKKLLKDEIKSDYLFILSPTLELSSDWDDFETNSSRQVYKKSTDFVKVLKEIFEKQESVIKRKRKTHKIPHIVIVLDDLLATNVLANGSYISKMSISARHYNISILVAVQRLAGLSRQFRLNAAYLFLFNPSNLSEAHRFISENIPPRHKKAFENKIEDIFNKPYNYIKVSAFGNAKERIYVNGIELIKF